MVERHQFGVDQVVGDKAGKYIIFIKSNLYIYIYIYIPLHSNDYKPFFFSSM